MYRSYFDGGKNQIAPVLSCSKKRKQAFMCIAFAVVFFIFTACHPFTETSTYEPIDLSVTLNGASVVLNWDLVDGAASYTVYRSMTAGIQGSLIATTVLNNYIDTTVSNGATYFYQIRVVKEGGGSLVSIQKCAKPFASALWARTANNGTPDSPMGAVFSGITADKLGNVYVAGYQQGESYDYGDGVQVTHKNGVCPNAMLVKYKASGQALWARSVQCEGDLSSGFESLAVDSAGNIYAIGWLYGDGSEIFDFGNGIKIVAIAGCHSAVLVKYDSSGLAQWARTVTREAGEIFFNRLALDNMENVLIAGDQAGTESFDYGNGVSLKGVSEDTNAVLVKYDGSGEAQWAKILDSIEKNASSFCCIAVDESNNVYVSGAQYREDRFYYGNGIYVTGDRYSNEILAKYDASGVAQWARIMSVGPKGFGCMGLATDSFGNVYAAGFQQGTGSYDYGNGVTATSNAHGSENCVLAKYNASGEAQWARTSCSGPGSLYYAVSVDEKGFIYTTGIIKSAGVIEFDDGVLVKGCEGGSKDKAVLVKYDSSGSAQWAQTTMVETGSSWFGSVVVAKDGYVYAAGFQEGTGIYGFGNDVSTSGSCENWNALLLKYGY